MHSPWPPEQWLWPSILGALVPLCTLAGQLDHPSYHLSSFCPCQPALHAPPSPGKCRAHVCVASSPWSAPTPPRPPFLMKPMGSWDPVSPLSHGAWPREVLSGEATWVMPAFSSPLKGKRRLSPHRLAQPCQSAFPESWAWGLESSPTKLP